MYHYYCRLREAKRQKTNSCHVHFISGRTNERTNERTNANDGWMDETRLRQLALLAVPSVVLLRLPFPTPVFLVLSPLSIGGDGLFPFNLPPPRRLCFFKSISPSLRLALLHLPSFHALIDSCHLPPSCSPPLSPATRHRQR